MLPRSRAAATTFFWLWSLCTGTMLQRVPLIWISLKRLLENGPPIAPASLMLQLGPDTARRPGTFFHEQPLILTGRSHFLFHRSQEAFCSGYPSGLDLFHFTIKCHYLSHIADKALHMTPRASWCYAGESFMSTPKRIVVSCVHGTQPLKVYSKAFRKFIDGMSYAVFGQAVWL